MGDLLWEFGSVMQSTIKHYGHEFLDDTNMYYVKNERQKKSLGDL